MQLYHKARGATVCWYPPRSGERKKLSEFVPGNVWRGVSSITLWVHGDPLEGDRCRNARGYLDRSTWLRDRSMSKSIPR